MTSLKLTRRDIKRITIAAAIAGIAFLTVSLIFYLTSPILDFLVVIAFAIAVTPPGIASVIHNRWRIKIETEMPEFLRDLSTSIQTGMPLQQALENVAKRNYGPLTAELKMLVAQISWGMTFQQALTEFSKRIDLPTVKNSSVLIIEAQRHGGDLSDIFDQTAKYAENMNQWAAKRNTQTLPYVAIFYFSVAVFLFIVIVLSSFLFLPVSQLTANGNPLIKPIFTPLEARRLFLDTALFESLFGGLIAGKINEDSFIGGLKHAAILAIISGITFYIFFK